MSLVKSLLFVRGCSLDLLFLDITFFTAYTPNKYWRSIEIKITFKLRKKITLVRFKLSPLHSGRPNKKVIRSTILGNTLLHYKRLIEDSRLEENTMCKCSLKSKT